MRYFFLMTVGIILATVVQSQSKKLSVRKILLPTAISYYDNQFSGLQIADEKIYLMSESRLQDKREAILYTIKLTDINYQLKDSTYTLPYEKIFIYGLDSLAIEMKKNGQQYEGLEAFVIKNQTVYFSVETTTPSSYCYLLKGSLDKGSIYLQPKLIAMPKPHKPGSVNIYNAGFEAITIIRNKLYAFFEYNYFNKNYAYGYDTTLNKTVVETLQISKLPFRITDITPVGNNHFTAINFFYKGDGADTVYRVSASDKPADILIRKQNAYYDYCRLIDIHFSNNHFSWKPLWTFPPEYTGYNWEGIAAYNKGYFVINDKYTIVKPYASVLLYIK